jgi:ABC-2 type transport system ATP-binding protein
MSIIKLNELTKFYGKNKGIENLSLEVFEGDIFGFIGPNGAGKSTTIRLMMNFIYPTSGALELMGEDVTKSSDLIRREIGYLPSEVYYYDTIKVDELLRYSAKLKGVKDYNQVNKLIDAFELETNKKFGQLSFGNKKKVGIVQAMMHNPKLLILDEPTNGLDPLVQKTLLELLREGNKKGTTVFFSSHTLSVVQKMCNRIGIIKDGEMLEVETYDSIREKRLKKIIMETDEILPVQFFDENNIENLIRRDKVLEFYYKGDINMLFKKFGGITVTDFTMQEPELEEIFMHFYMKEGGRS